MQKDRCYFKSLALLTLTTSHLMATPYFYDSGRGWFWGEVEPEPIIASVSLPKNCTT